MCEGIRCRSAPVGCCPVPWWPNWPAAEGLGGGFVRAVAGGEQVRDENRGQDADDGDDDEKLDKGEALVLTVAHGTAPLG